MYSLKKRKMKWAFINKKLYLCRFKSFEKISKIAKRILSTV